MFVTFLFSAIAHELLVGIPCHVLRLWAFGGIMAQIPLIAFTSWTSRTLKNEQLGNVVFWLSFCILGQARGSGPADCARSRLLQPAAILLYYKDWTNRHASSA
jgi:diacylglycerol O-acyltransferase-1